MKEFLIVAIVFNWILVGVGCWLGWQLLRQNGRVLLRLDEIEKRLDELELAGADEPERLSDNERRIRSTLALSPKAREKIRIAPRASTIARWPEAGSSVTD